MFVLCSVAKCCMTKISVILSYIHLLNVTNKLAKLVAIDSNIS